MNAIAFSDRFRAFAPGLVPFRQRSLEDADRWVSGLQADGGTELLEPLLQAVEQVRDGVVVLLTDGQVGNEDEILRRVQAKGVQGALISKTVQRFTSEQVNPVVVGGAVSSGWDAAGFYEYWSAPLTFAEYTTEENKFIGETVLWALPDDKAMWAMRTSTRRTDPGAFADDIAATVAADLRKAGIVPE